MECNLESKQKIEENGTACFVMDFMEGISFEQYIREHGGKVGCEEAVKILFPIMDALAAAHGRGIIHQDLALDNIYITKEKKVRILGFGGARYSLENVHLTLLTDG